MDQGLPHLYAIRQIGVVEQNYYRRRQKYGGMGIDQLKELKRFQKQKDSGPISKLSFSITVLPMCLVFNHL